MQNGASVSQLLSGIAGLDYICYASKLSKWQQERRESLELEANIRIDLDQGEQDGACVESMLKTLLHQINNLYNTRIINKTSTLEHILDYLKARKSIS